MCIRSDRTHSTPSGNKEVGDQEGSGAKEEKVTLTYVRNTWASFSIAWNSSKRLTSSNAYVEFQQLWRLDHCFSETQDVRWGHARIQTIERLYGY